MLLSHIIKEQINHSVDIHPYCHILSYDILSLSLRRQDISIHDIDYVE